MSIAKDFSDFGPELTGLRRKLRDLGARIYDTFPDYGRDFRRHLGIESEQAMDLFHQTVSMKAVDNLNDFVRAHMLEPFDTKARIESLVEHFDNLTKAHDAVIRARAQLELLTPLTDALDSYDDQTATIATLERQRAALPFFFAARRERSSISSSNASPIESLHSTNKSPTRTRKPTVSATRTNASAFRSPAAAGTGWSTSRSRSSGTRTSCQNDERSSIASTSCSGRLGSTASRSPTSSSKRRKGIASRDDELNGRLTSVENDLTERRHEHRSLNDEAQAVNDELRSLQSRQSNLPRRSLELRDQLCTDLEIDTDELPFAGQLVQVRDDAREWEGAAERVLRNFALSLLVPNDHYEAVAAWIDSHHLNARVVYFRVPERPAPDRLAERRAAQPLLVDMLEVKPDSAFAPWLGVELERRADHVCVGSVERIPQR